MRIYKYVVSVADGDIYIPMPVDAEIKLFVWHLYEAIQ